MAGMDDSLEVAPAAGPLIGDLRPPGDKSITHRALILAGLACGQSRLRGLLRSADTDATRAVMSQMGARFERDGDALLATGVGVAGLAAPKAPLDVGNSGTAMRLLAGVLAAQPFESMLTGDASLSRRPMRRIIEPLGMMGADIEGSAAGTAPLRIRGQALHGIDYVLPVASAQVKSCLLLAGLYADGLTRITETVRTRDHTERMLPVFGVTLEGPCAVRGVAALKAGELEVPADPSSAAFLLAAALLVPGSDLYLRGVGVNPTRDGFLRALQQMGAALEIRPCPEVGPEPIADIRARYSGRLRGIDLPAAWVPATVDEVPVLMALAASAEGRTRIRGAGELRVKESDRLSVMTQGLRALGVPVREYEDGVDIEGISALRTAPLDAAGDHRCAMSFAVLGLLVPGGVRIHDAREIDTSYPGFTADLGALGAQLAFGAKAGG